MANNRSAQRRAFLLLEISLVGLLGWMVVTSNTLNGGVKAGGRDQNPKKLKKNQERTLPTEGLPGTDVSPLVATNGATCNVLFDFESGDQGFTGTALSGPQLWHRSDLCRANLAGHSLTHSFYYGQDATCNYNTGARNASNLVSPPISLAGKLPPFSLTFNYLLFVEGGGFDTTFVDVSTDGGTTWTEILSKANLINDNQWHFVGTDVSTQLGAATSFLLRFRFDSIDAIANATTGWHIDDIAFCAAFNVCIQDDSSKSVLKINTSTGDYEYNNCAGTIVAGTGVVTVKGSIIQLQDFRVDRRVLVKIDQSVAKGTASIQLLSPMYKQFFITDRNTLDNTCACP